MKELGEYVGWNMSQTKGKTFSPQRWSCMERWSKSTKPWRASKYFEFTKFQSTRMGGENSLKPERKRKFRTNRRKKTLVYTVSHKLLKQVIPKIGSGLKIIKVNRRHNIFMNSRDTMVYWEWIILSCGPFWHFVFGLLLVQDRITSCVFPAGDLKWQNLCAHGGNTLFSQGP